jgi:cysteine desulfuration protein SufE
MTLSEKQQQVVADLADMNNWEDRFNYLILLADELAPMPEHMKTFENRIDCQSRTYLCVQRTGGVVKLYGWSNGIIPAGLLALVIDIFNGRTDEEIRATDTTFHIESGLLDNLTGIRRNALIQMLQRITLI